MHTQYALTERTLENKQQIWISLTRDSINNNFGQGRCQISAIECIFTILIRPLHLNYRAASRKHVITYFRNYGSHTQKSRKIYEKLVFSTSSKSFIYTFRASPGYTKLQCRENLETSLIKMATKKQLGNINNLIQPLLTDKYQVSMCYAYWLDGKHDESSVFDLYFRKNPFKGEYTIFAGLEECLKYINTFRFTEDDIDYLKNISDYAHMKEEFWLYLKRLNSSTLKLYALNEGTVCFPNLPLVRLEGPLGLLQLVETTLLNLINYASLVATNAARYRIAANSGNMVTGKLLEFGLRRAQGPDGGFSASRYSYIGGFDATSNLLAGKEFGIPVSGTQSHSFIMAYFGASKLDRDNQHDHKYLLNKNTGTKENFTMACLDAEQTFLKETIVSKKCRSDCSNSSENSEFRAFVSFAWAFPDSFLALVDTYDVVRSGLVNFCIVAIALLKFGYQPIGIRIDSGDLAYLSRFARDLFTLLADTLSLKQFNEFEIVASNDINEETINSLNDQNHAITSLGIGTHLVTCQSQPALGCVYKLVETNGNPCMKLSSMPEKITIPCKKMAFRLYGKDGHALLDYIVMHGETVPAPGERILCRHPFIAEKRCYATPTRIEPLLTMWWDGQTIRNPPSLFDIRNHCIKSLSYLTEDIKRSLNPTPYKVSVSNKLFDLLNQLKVSLTPIGELS